MKQLYKALAVSLLLIPALGFCADNKDSESLKHSGMKKGMMSKMSPEQIKQHLRDRQEEMLKMHDYSNRILAEKDPEKAQKLKDEQLKLMQAHMEKMRAHRQKMKEKHHKMMQKKNKE